MTDDVVTELRLSAMTSHVAMQTNVKIRKTPKIPKPVRLARSHIAYAVHLTTEHQHADNPSGSFGGDTSNYKQTLTEIIYRYLVNCDCKYVSREPLRNYFKPARLLFSFIGLALHVRNK